MPGKPTSRLDDTGILHYDASAGTISTAFRLANTVAPHVFKRLEFWFFLALHLTFVALFYYGYIPKSTKEKKYPYTMMDWNDVKVVTAITTFFEVFYTNQSFSRYMQLYSVIRKLLLEMLHICLEIRLHFRPADCVQYARLSCRYLFASILIFFEDEVGRSHEGTSKNSKKKKKKLTRERLLRPEELAFLSHFPEEKKAVIVMHWSAEVFLHGWRKANLPANTQKSVVDKMYKVFFQTKVLADTVGLPIPFQYFHLLNVMVCVNLFCWAYIMGASDSAGGTVIFFFAALIFVGMMELASQLSDPFGDDEVDFPCNQWLLDFFQKGELLLEYDGANLQDLWMSSLASEGSLGLVQSHPDDSAATASWTWPRPYLSNWQYAGVQGAGALAPVPVGRAGPPSAAVTYSKMAAEDDGDDDGDDDD